MTKEQQVGERLNTFRIELGLTQTVFAQTVGIKQGYLNQVIKGLYYHAADENSEYRALENDLF